MITDFKTFLDNLIVENLHPELQKIAASSDSYKSKQSQLANKIKDLTNRGEKTGVEGNMPQGSSRAYLKHSDKHEAIVDGKKTQLETGTKVAIRANLDSHHKKNNPHEIGLGAMQNRAENADNYTNHHHRILSKDHHTGEYHTNHDYGIFPPLIDHDHQNHEWSHTGHARDIKAGEFRKLTKNKAYPKGISHEEFHTALKRNYDKNNGKYWGGTLEHEKHMDHVTDHPLVQKFKEYHDNTGHPPHDYGQLKNLGVWHHPIDGSQHIVARDHGFDTEVAHAYSEARKRKMNRK